MKKNKSFIVLLTVLALIAVFFLTKLGSNKPTDPVNPDPPVVDVIDENGKFYSAEDVAKYLNTYGKLPSNFITKKDAKEQGWTSGPADKVLEGMAIGGDKYANAENKLPVKSDRQYYVCDIDTLGAEERGTKRIVYSNDGLIYYTENFYETFTLLYGEVTVDPVDPNQGNNTDNPGGEDPGATIGEITVYEDGKYYSKDEVALYLFTYRHLPSNYVTKSQAKKAGWNGGAVDKYIAGAVIGGDKFGNNEGVLPKEDGVTYTECDIDNLGKKSRGTKRIVFSSDGKIYYTEDHYETFELLYDWGD